MYYLIWGFGALVALLAWYFLALIFGKPWTVQGLFTRTFLKFALKGPELLTDLGLLEKFGFHGHNAKLSDASEAFGDKMFAFLKRDLKILRSYRRERLSPALDRSVEVMDWFLDDNARGETWRYHDFPVNQMFGVQSNLPDFMLTMHPLNHPADIRHYVRRLAKFGVKIDQVLEGLAMREARSCLPPRFVIDRVLAEMKAFVAHAPDRHPLYTTFRDKVTRYGKLRAARVEVLCADASDEIARTVYPAYGRLIGYFSGLQARVTADNGVWALPDGDQFYAHCLRSNTTTDYTPQQVHDIGLAEVERIEGEMRAIMADQGYGQVTSPALKLAELGQEERFLYPDNDEGRVACLADYQRYLDEMDARLEPYFSLRPKAQLKVERISEFKETTAPGAYYQPADLGGARPGVFYANLRDMKEVHKFGMKTLAYHEGIPGHHFQIAIAQELKGLPFFRRMLPFTAYAEGWAMYSEQLAREIGLYRDDPFGLLGSLDSELFRAVRLVVDTGIHYRKWTRRQAIDYMSAHTAQAVESVVSEVERYFVMPGQACAYKLGMIKLLELRDKAKRALGNGFELRRWHGAVLADGGIPLATLEKVVDAWISAELAVK
ncbi:MAG: hypothetical protein A2087_11715 [Spirochaetes bacterium GWD1_61_31]|nr:MAG: hypothetical protein A2Y37_13935 [Spirochaetes bacterium GWB1_60_80]OHD31075.1 MAG: hypothetical protein A2004_07745 [Spirochaetes bacterium GWC1_61_12]OHD41629.1 MAG: hypothetical protein A2087_11715 [Spirochaetes bacterium GWD1_61_31]OHD45290.1 MAG: hypothetical protein A2Y35_02515 [Spirochaetes bacterium GWE1_60_18]OHD59596.1 MAG: hypothetical protein A2Y32_12760 [Spirochaetes bacterium GWF1_60_12]HAP43992.1 DUF885 domain-containing protein [Spirochaetaceae bacterium]